MALFQMDVSWQLLNPFMKEEGVILLTLFQCLFMVSCSLREEVTWLGSCHSKSVTVRVKSMLLQTPVLCSSTMTYNLETNNLWLLSGKRTGTWGWGRNNEITMGLVLFDSDSIFSTQTKQKPNELHVDKGLRKTGLNQEEQIKLLWNFLELLVCLWTLNSL